LSSIFVESDDKLIRSLWCDGVLMPYFEWQFTKKRVNNTRRIETKAWIGRIRGEQWLFDLTIHFGKYSLRRYARGTSLEDCLPDIDDIVVDFGKKYIEIFMR
jgi:hypothetical protein